MRSHTTMLLLAMLMTAAGSASAATTTVRVSETDESLGVDYLRFFPETVVVREGDEVVWKAGGDSPHTVTQFPPGPTGFDSSPALRPDDPDVAREFGPGGFLLPGQAFRHAFTENGTFEYHCKIHPTMSGKVTVVGEPGEGVIEGTALVAVGWGSGDTSVNRFGPNDITILKGSTVEWINLHSAEPHTVTAMPPDPMAPVGPENPVAFDSSPVVGPPPGAFFDPEGGVLWQAFARTEFRQTFEEAGTYEYFCKLHPGMRGTVIVLEKEKEPAKAEVSGTPELPPPTESKSVPAVGALAVALAGIAVALVARRRSG